MADSARKDAPTVTVPADAFERMLAELARHNELAAKQTQLLAQIVQTEERRLAQAEDVARRAMNKTGPTTDEAARKVAERHRKLGL